MVSVILELNPAEKLVVDIRSLIDAGRDRVDQAVNSELVMLHWHIGDRYPRHDGMVVRTLLCTTGEIWLKHILRESFTLSRCRTCTKGKSLRREDNSLPSGRSQLRNIIDIHINEK